MPTNNANAVVQPLAAGWTRPKWSKAQSDTPPSFANALASIKPPSSGTIEARVAPPTAKPQAGIAMITSALESADTAPATTTSGATPNMGVILPNTLGRAQAAFDMVFGQQIQTTWQAAAAPPPDGVTPHDRLLGNFPMQPATNFISEHKLDMGSFDPFVRNSEGGPSIGPDCQPVTWLFRDLGNERYALTPPTGILSPWTSIYDFNTNTVQPLDGNFGSTKPILTTDMSQSQKTNLRIAWDLSRKFGVTPQNVLDNLTEDHQFKQNPATLWGPPRTA
ncbi:MAG: hypothetical protein EXQ87_02720 [Alphaproteobacteria bacterium]|nr:hypothetical protein [Alphaproteobacteria bacterium]